MLAWPCGPEQSAASSEPTTGLPFPVFVPPDLGMTLAEPDRRPRDQQPKVRMLYWSVPSAGFEPAHLWPVTFERGVLQRHRRCEPTRPSGPVGPIDSNPPCAHRSDRWSTRSEIWCSTAGKAVVDGVLDGGRQTNRRTTGHQADEKHQILGREQHRRTTTHRTDDQHQTTDLAVGGSNPSRRALTSRFGADAWSRELLDGRELPQKLPSELPGDGPGLCE